MFSKTRLFTPGPTPLLPSAQFAMAAADIHHRTPEFKQLMLRVRDGLQKFIGTTNDVIILASSGTGAMEASVANLTNPGDEVLVLSAGKFGERWTGLAKAYGCKATVVSAPYGETISIDEVRNALTAQTRVVFMQATESSTGARHCVEAVAELLAGTDTLLVVDAITGLGTTHLKVDGLIDVIIGGSQKALMIPPGLAYLAISERAWARMETSTQPRYYFDLRKERKSQVKGETAYTPAVALIAAMGAALDYLSAKAVGDVAAGRELLVDNAELCAEMTRTAALALGLELFAPTAPAAAATAIKAPANFTATDIVKRLKSEFSTIVTDGQGEMKGHIFRIAHIGFFDYMDTIAVIGALEQVLHALDSRYVLGRGLTAAQQVYLSHVRGSAPQLCACGRDAQKCLVKREGARA
ncbi:MAG TPA: alanine--glyoxylate aminotransferase family protein [candidate division Zixibacteria bacterium]|nr:alanine--glyoxylate aminotransferase family protein [candidate division Zixibacteria bacterium]